MTPQPQSCKMRAVMMTITDIVKFGVILGSVLILLHVIWFVALWLIDNIWIFQIAMTIFFVIMIVAGIMVVLHITYSENMERCKKERSP